MDAFLRIQKSGSTSLRKSLENSPTIQNIDHAYCFRLIRQNTGWNFTNTNFPTFDRNNFDRLYALVRNPFEILVSYYHHTHPWSDGLDGWVNCNKVHGFKSWREFLDGYLDPNLEWHLPPMKKSMFSLAYDRAENLIIYDYFKLEEPDRLEGFIKYHRGTPLGVDNKTKNKPKKSMRDFYTDDDVDRLKEIWKKDLNYFGYDFNFA